MIERGRLVRHEPATRTVIVERVATLSPGFVRVTLGGDELHGFTSLGAADHVKVFFENDARRDYTPRAFRHATAESTPQLDIDFYLHGDGPAANWVRSVTVGDRVVIGGPRGSHLLPTGAERFVLAADETALPALARWIELLPDDTEIFGFVELDNPSDAAYLEPAHVHRARIVWLPKSDGALERAIRGLGSSVENSFVWLAGEATALVPVRRYLRRDLGLSREQVKVDGYWKRGEAGRDHHAPVDPEDPED